MKEIEIRPLRADEIECRVGMVNEKGLSLLLYKDARADMKILDETFGLMNWQRKHEVIGGNLYCTVSIWDGEKSEWISKMDVGTESHAEKEKGQASDSFKRACVSVGIGRELYTAPFIWVSAAKTDIIKKGDKLMTYDKFSVSGISYGKNREITGLTVVNQSGQTVYEMQGTPVHKPGVLELSEKQTRERSPQEEGGMSEEKIADINRELARTGVALDTVLKRYGITAVRQMSEDTYRKAMNSLKRTKTKVA